MKRSGLGGILALLLCLGLVSLEARGDDLQRFLAQIQREAASKPVARRPAKPSRFIGEKAGCTAYCGEGTPVSVDCPVPSGCTAVDQNCSANQPGYAQCSGGSPVFCSSTCPTTYTAECQNGTTVSVNCPGSGTQVNHACPAEPGHVQCSSGERVDCRICEPICQASAPCLGGGSVSCEGYYRCESYPGGCRVRCDGQDDSCECG